MPRFVHLRLHTDYSLIDGLVRIKPLVKHLAAQSVPAIAITDHHNFCGLIKFFKACEQAGIKPIAGADLRIHRPDKPEKPFWLTLLAQNEKGYRNLTELLSRSYLEGQVEGLPRLRREWLPETSEGLIALSGARFGEVGRLLLEAEVAEAEAQLRWWMKCYPNAFYLELQRTGRADEDRYLHAAVELAGRMSCPVVATNEVHFLQPEDYEAHEARVCINEGKTLDDPRRERRFSPQQYLRSEEEMVELFSDLPEALQNSVEIARRCNLELSLGQYFLPEFPVPAGLTLEAFFRQQAMEGLQGRLQQLEESLPDSERQDAGLREARWQQYRERLEFELDIILQMGFPGYFLIVMDFIKWAKTHGVPVGPGRGSGAGSLVAYALEITDLDPIAYDLLFERFLNPERVSMPDFDVDFCMTGRDRVIQYVAQKYGRHAVSQIITFGTMAAKAVVRDVARIQGRPYAVGDRISKMIPFEVGMTLAKALQQEETLQQMLENDEEASAVWEMATKLEGVTRNVGKHAGGVVIAPSRLTDFSPLYCDSEGEGLVTQFDKDDVEEAGLVKFDFLGLRTLTIVDSAVRMINARQPEAVDINQIPLDDKATFDLLKRAETTAVFQLESRGMKDLIRRLLPDCFEDIVALVALFRPGPLGSGMVDDFINRKHGRAPLAFPHPDYQHPSLKPVLQPTYGIILYQEQVMQIAQVLAGYSLGGADLLRRAMGKKKAEVMEQQKEVFLAGAQKNGIAVQLAEQIFLLVEKFAGYGFNKSHSAAYALVSYQTAWLKTHFPAPFMAAVLTADMQNTDKVVTLIEECRRMQLELVLPDINCSVYEFTVDEGNRIIYGLGAIKGLGEGPAQAITEARAEGGAFLDLFDFCARVDLQRVNKRALEALIRSGAFDAIGPGRARLMASVPEAVQRAGQAARNQSAGLVDLFGDLQPGAGEAEQVYAATAGLRDWTEKERLRQEKETLGLYISGHPFDEVEKEVRRLAPTRIADLKAGKESCKVAGLIVSQRVIRTRSGSQMAVIALDDRSGRIEATLFSDVFAEIRDRLQVDTLLIVEGEVQEDEFSGGLRIRARSAADLDSARLRFVRQLQLRLGPEDFAQGLHQKLNALLQPDAEGCPICIEYRTEEAIATVRLDPRWKLRPDDASLQALRYLLGQDRVELCYD